jgi:hypothetical protein
MTRIPGPPRNSVKDRTELVIAVADEELRRLTVHRGVSELLRGPLSRRATRRGHGNHSARAEMHDEEREYRSKKHVVRLHEVAAPGHIGVIAQECGPSLATRRAWSFSHVLLDGSLAHANPKLE